MEDQFNTFFLGMMKRHLHWYVHLGKFCDYLNIQPPKLPDFGIYQKAGKFTGEYLFGYYMPPDHACYYNIVTALSSKWEETDNTIAHEMCHAFQRTICKVVGNDSPYTHKQMKGEPHPFFTHDAMFHMLMRHCRMPIRICGFDHFKGAAYSKLFRGKRYPEFLIKTKDYADTVGMFSAGKEFDSLGKGER